MKVDRPDEIEAGEVLPDGTEIVVWLGGSDFRLNNCSEYDKEIFPDELDLSPVDGRRGNETDPTIIYEPGDELPLPVARDQWKYHSDRMAAFDDDKRRLDESTKGENRSAIDQWMGRTH